MDESEFLTAVHKHIKAMTADGDLGLSGYIWRHNGDSFSITACDLDPPQVWALFFIEAAKPDTQKIAFCIDRFSKPHQGTTLSDLVAGLYWDVSNPIELPRKFIIEYQFEPDHRILWFNWNNEFWNKALSIEYEGTLNAMRTGDFSKFRNMSVDENGKMTIIPRGNK